MRVSWLKIYRCVYYYFAPFALLQSGAVRQQDFNDLFLADEAWAQSLRVKEKKKNDDIKLKHSNFNTKKNKNANNISHINVKEELEKIIQKQQNDIDWKTLSMSIVKLISKEQKIASIEKQIENEILAQDNDDNKVKITQRKTIKDILKQIQKNKFLDLQQVQKEIESILTNYQIASKIGREQKQEYLDIIERFFKEAQELVKENKGEHIFKLKQPLEPTNSLGAANNPATSAALNTANNSTVIKLDNSTKIKLGKPPSDPRITLTQQGGNILRLEKPPMD